MVWSVPQTYNYYIAHTLLGTSEEKLSRVERQTTSISKSGVVFAMHKSNEHHYIIII